MFKTLRVGILVLSVALALLCVSGTAHAYVWNFTNAADYYVDGDPVIYPDGFGGSISYMPVITVGDPGSAYVPARPYIDQWDDPPIGSDWASVFARVNTQAPAPGLGVGGIYGGGFAVTGMNHPDAVYGSLYLSPTGGPGSTVMINMSPMGRIGLDGAYDYTFDRSTAADVKIKNGPGGAWGIAQYTGTFGGAIGWVNASAYSDTYAAFFGPQIGMSNTSGTTFTITEIELSDVPEPTTMLLLGGVLAGLGLMRLRKKS